MRIKPPRTAITVGSLVVLGLSLVGCGANDGGSDTDTGSSGGAKPPARTEVVVHNAVGGGSDVFTRQLIKIMRQEGVISSNWPVRNIPAGDTIGAMSYLLERKGKDDAIAQMTPTWLVTPMTISGGQVSVADLTPIAGLASEPQVVAVRADSPYETLTDYMEAAKGKPNELIQAGGSTTATDSLTGLALQSTTGTKWKFLSFEDTGSRITALLRGDADIMFGGAGDFTEQVKAKKLKVITVIGDKPLDLFPGAKTVSEQGIALDKLPLQFRGILGAADMPAEAVKYYQDAFQKVLQTEAWAAFAKEEGLVTDYRDSAAFSAYLDQRTEVLGGLLDQLGLRKDR